VLQLLSASELKISGLCDATLRLACQILHDLCTRTRALVQLDTGSQQEKLKMPHKAINELETSILRAVKW
jgi:hypothetical protein